MRSPEAVAAMLCPVCKTTLTFSERSGVEIDVCATCRGVWLDRGELDKIIDRSTADAAPARPRDEPPRQDHRTGGYRADDDDDDDDDRNRHGRRKRSFLSNLFD